MRFGISRAGLVAGCGWLARGYRVSAATRSIRCSPRRRRTSRPRRSVIFYSCPVGLATSIYSGKAGIDPFGGTAVPESFEHSRRAGPWRNKLLAPVRPFRKYSPASTSPISCRTSRRAWMTFACCAAVSATASRIRVGLLMNGSILMGRPSLGAWATYGLGSENQNIPAFVVMHDPAGCERRPLGETATCQRCIKARSARRITILHLNTPQISPAQQQPQWISSIDSTAKTCAGEEHRN